MLRDVVFGRKSGGRALSLCYMKSKKIRIGGVVILAIIIGLIVFRVQVMRGLGNWLVAEDELQQVEVMFVLSGGPFDRGLEASKVYKAGYAPLVVCTGELVPQDVFALGYHYTEGDVSKVMMQNNGVPDSVIMLIKKGTSTQEESEVIYEYCQQHHIKKAMVLSTKFHTRRVKQVFKKRFKDSDTEVMIHGAPAAAYDEENWWQNEHGLIALNNEYMKILYYWVKY